MVGPNGRVRMSEKNVPTITGLTNSGTTKSTISMRLPANARSMASASRKPSTSSTATAAAESPSVTQSACRAIGSSQTVLKLSSATQRWPGMAKS